MPLDSREREGEEQTPGEVARVPGWARRMREILGTRTQRGILEYSNLSERQSLRRRETNGNWFGTVLRARAVRDRLGFETSRRKASARGGESPEALAWLPPALSWITRASSLRTQCYCMRPYRDANPLRRSKRRRWRRRRRRWLPHKRDMHGRLAPASTTLVARERKRETPCLEIILNIFKRVSSLSLSLFLCVRTYFQIARD